MSIPKPLVQLNQLFIVITVLLALLAAKWLLLLPFLVGVVTLVTKRNPVIMAGKSFSRNLFLRIRWKTVISSFLINGLQRYALGLLSFHFT